MVVDCFILFFLNRYLWWKCAEGFSKSWVNDKSMGGKGANFTKDCLFHHCSLSVLSMNLMSKADLK